MRMFKAVVAESCPGLIHGIMNWLDTNDHFSSIASSSDWDEVKKLLEENSTDILIITEKWIINSPGIPMFMKYFSESQVNVLCIVDSNTSNNIIELYDSGIQCLIAMSDSQEEFLWGIKALVNGKRHISSELLSNFIELPFSRKAHKLHHISLTKREEEILELISQGYTNKEIGVKLFLSKRTVDGYREAVLDKFGAKNTAQLMTIITDNHNSQRTKMQVN